MIMEEFEQKEFENALEKGTLACEICNKNNQAHITALEQHLSDMRLIVFGHYLKAEVKDVKKDQKPVQG